MRLEKAAFNPFAISASDNAQLEESEAKDRDLKKQNRVEEFLTQTKMNVKRREQKVKEEERQQ